MRKQKTPEPTDPNPRSLTVKKKIAFSLITVIGLFAFLEFGLRVARIGEPPIVGSLRFGYDTGIPIYDSDGILREGEPYQDVPLFEADPILFWKPIANTPFTGVDGLRLKTPSSLQKKEGVYRVAVVGDSCSFLGMDLYPNRFAELVGQTDDTTIEIINASCPGYTSFQGTGRLSDVWQWDPDAIIVYFGWNDHWKSLNGQTDRDVTHRQVLSNEARTWLGKSRLFWTLYSFRSKLAPPEPISRGPVRVPPQHYRENLVAMARNAQDHNCKAIFITAPSAYLDGQMPPWAYGFFGQIYQMSSQEVSDIPSTHARYNEIVRDVAKSAPNGILLDIAQQWSSESEIAKQPERFRSDRIHLTEGGHQEIAQQLTRLWNERLSPSPK